MTFSIAGFCSRTGMVGCAISSSSISVASRCAFAHSGSGVVLTQNITNPALGPQGLKYLGTGLSAEQSRARLKQADSHIAHRQLGILDTRGNSATFSGDKTLGIHATAQGKECLAMGNLLANTSIPQTMVESFVSSADLDLPTRLLNALQAGWQQGGEMGPVHSAGLLVYLNQSWPAVDLRVDWDEEPITQLFSLWQIYQPQMNDYLLRAENPDQAANYGVPGDE